MAEETNLNHASYHFYLRHYLDTYSESWDMTEIKNHLQRMDQPFSRDQREHQ